jgi:PAS domain S-box-containing protein
MNYIAIMNLSKLCRLILITQLLLFFKYGICFAQEKEIKIGVLAKQGTDIALQTWEPTADYLNERFKEYKFTIVPMDFGEIPLLVDKQLVDFVVVNSAIYVDLSVRFGLRRILTLKNRYNAGKQATEFGSVIFTRSDNAEIRAIKDLKKHTLAAVHPTSFGGWLMALREINEQGLSSNDLSEIHFKNTHNAVVQSVINKITDVGIVRTDTLERMAQEGKIDINQFRIVNEQHYTGFPFKVSTRLYPEWPLAKLEHTSSVLARSVAIAMIQMPEHSKAAIAADIQGWTIPENYQPVHDILRQLKRPPYESYGKVTFEKIITSYKYWVFAILAVVFIQTGLIAGIFKLNYKLRKQKRDLTQSEERFKATFDQAAVGILHVSINGELLRVNQKFCRDLGYSETEIRKLNFNDFSDPAEISYEFHQLDKMRQNEIDSFTYQKKYKRKNRSPIIGLTTVSCIRGADGNIKFLVVVVDDLSEVINLEQKIIKQQKQNQLILDLAGDGILGLDVKAIHTYVNPAAAKLFGWDIDEMIGKNSHEMWHHSYADGSEFTQSSCPITQVIEHGKIHRGVDETMWKKDGSSFQAEYISTPIYEDEVITGAVVVVRETQIKSS